LALNLGGKFMKRLGKWMGWMTVGMLAAAMAGAAEEIPLDRPWKRVVSEFADKHLQHSAWGVGHSRRNYLLSTALARDAGLTVDSDVLFAAAFLHDMGGFPAFERKGVDHAVRSAELVGPILKSAGFPLEKLEAVKGVILAHTYYNPKAPVTAEEIVFRDADVLDFLGNIGAARLLSITARESFAPTLADAVKTVETLGKSLGPKLLSSGARREGARRLQETGQILKSLSRESFGGRIY
jgi:uncharacterized protein